MEDKNIERIVPRYKPNSTQKYLTPIEKITIVIIPVSSRGFVNAFENLIPQDLYEIASVDMNIAGKAANIPPNTGPPILESKTANVINKPPNRDLIVI